MTTFDEIYTKFFSKIQKDKSFFLSNVVSPQEAYQQAIVNAENYLEEAIVEIILSDKEDMPIDLIGIKNNSLKRFDETLNLVEIDLITDLMVEKHMERTIVERLNFLQTRYHTSELKVFCPADAIRAFQSSFTTLKNTNRSNIRSYKKRDRNNFKYRRFDYSIFN